MRVNYSMVHRPDLELAMLDEDDLLNDLGDIADPAAAKEPELDLPKAEAKPVKEEQELASLMK